MNEFDLEQLLHETVATHANPAIPASLAERLKTSGLAQQEQQEETMSSNVLTFGTLDQVATGRDTRKTAAGAALLHAAALALIFMQMRALHERVAAPRTTESEAFLTAPPIPLPTGATRSGGGGGHTGTAPAAQGNLPKFAAKPLMAPQIQKIADAKLPVDPSIAVQDLHMAKTDLPQFGLPNGANVGVSLGTGRGGGIGSGDGNGMGPGSGGNLGDGIRHVGGSVRPPEILVEPVPEFSEEARKAKVAGNVLVYLVVDEQGRPTHIRVLHGIGMGLDEKALEAVRQYRFKPATEDGKPVRVELQVDVRFDIF
jgi:protein TonB